MQCVIPSVFVCYVNYGLYYTNLVVRTFCTMSAGCRMLQLLLSVGVRCLGDRSCCAATNARSSHRAASRRRGNTPLSGGPQHCA